MNKMILLSALAIVIIVTIGIISAEASGMTLTK